MDLENINPYITVLLCNGRYTYGILRAKTKEYTSVYNFELMNEQQKITMLNLAKLWWWESNRTIPISVYMQAEMEQFKLCITRFNTSTVTFLHGPTISLSEIPSKRIKRRNITLKKKR